MAQLVPITLDDGTTIYIQANDDLVTPEASLDNVERGRVAKGAGDILQNQFESIKGTIKSYTRYTLNAFEELGSANVEKVTLEFGITVAGKAGIPYVTEGSTEGNLKITVECVWPKDKAEPEQGRRAK